MNPRPADEPISVLEEPLRGAIALAVNGVPIFCALNNRAEDTFLAGELDQWGGHCGRGDDYHYHIAPIHLEEQVGVGNPIAYALDGYPILGLSEADGEIPEGLDPFNGHTHDGNYHYHATKTFPYINGGLHGVVQMQGDQIEQPRDSPTRPGQPPLRGARITGFERDGTEFDLTYEISGKEAHVRYRILGDDRVEFTYLSPDGSASTQTYQRRQPGERGPGMSQFWIAGIAAFVAVIALLIAIRKFFRRSSSPIAPI
ncbi:MAG: YHYH protein [Planctomycetota bacterium]